MHTDTQDRFTRANWMARVIADAPPLDRFAVQVRERHHAVEQSPTAAGAEYAAARLPIGAEVCPTAACHFRVWAPRRKQVEVVFEGESGSRRPSAEPRATAISPASPPRRATWHAVPLPARRRASTLYPDPASGFSPRAPHGPSQVVDPGRVRLDRRTSGAASPRTGRCSTRCTSARSPGRHLGRPPSGKLPDLARPRHHLPRGDAGRRIPGRFGWGYDGVDLFAPTRLYGTPDDFRRFVDRAHALGIGVILDVVYNHLGPDGNYLERVLRRTTSPRSTRTTGASRSISTTTGAAGVREFFVSNARHWIDEYHLDGFRFDATQAILDDSPEHILAAICRAAAAGGGRRRSISSPKTSRSTRASFGRRSRAATGWTRCGTTTSITRAMVALTGPQRGVLHRLPRQAAGVRLRGQVGLPLPGAALQVAEEAPRHAGARICRRPRSSTTSRTTTRSPTTATASGAISSTSPAAVQGDDRPAAADAADADAVPGAGVRGHQPRSTTSPTTTPN